MDMPEIDPEQDFEEVLAEIKRVNATMEGRVRLGESDNFFSLMNWLPPAQPRRCREAIAELVAARESAGVGAVVGTYRLY